jgi:hypothetical protein
VIATKISTQRYVAPYWNSDNTIANGGRTTPVNTSGPVQAGDTILLMSGNYGDISISSVNTDFITVKAAPGQFPVLTSLTVTSSAKWVFSGLKIQHLNNRSLTFVGNDPTAGNLVTLSSNGVGGKGGGAVGPVTDIVFTGNLLSSADDTSSWTLNQWKQGTSNAININGLPLPTTPGGGSGGKCIAITHNDISDVNYGIQIGTSDTLVDSNRINHFDSDAIRIQSDNTTVTRNVITNASSFDGVAFTAVTMFSTSPDGNTAYERQNLVFDSNIVIDQTDPNLKYPAPVLGGMTMFTNDWDNVNFTNNIFIVSAKHDVTFFSVHGGICSNNTVLDDGSPGAGAGPGLQGLEFRPTGHDRLKGRPSDGVLIMTNNFAPNMRTMAPSLAGHTMTVENNVISRRWETDLSGLYPNIVSRRIDAPGVYPVNNTLDPAMSSYFTRVDTVNKVFDLHVKPSLGSAITKLGAQGPVLEVMPTHSAYHF